MIKNLMKTVTKAKPSPMQAADGLKMVYDAYIENKRIQETESTKRHEISARKEVDLERIKSQTKILEIYLENTFAERKVVISGMFMSLDKAIETNNQELIQQSLGSIVAIAKESPLAGIQNLVSDFNDDNVKTITI